MNETRMNNAYGPDGARPVSGAPGTAGGWPAQAAEESAAAAVASSSLPAASLAGPAASLAGPAASLAGPTAARAGPAVPLPAQRRSGPAADAAVPLRLVQVYLTPVIDEFLRQARSMAIVQGLDVSASAVVRHAMERLIATASPAEIVELLSSPRGQSRPRRGRPRRLMRSAYLNLCMHNS